jgi:hypothetical protein
MRIAAVIALLFVLAGCGYPLDIEKVMGRSTPEPVPSSPKLDCDLIFPAPLTSSTPDL